MKVDKVKLATKFDELLIKVIGPENYAEAIRLNQQEPDPEICHSHDFCDANMVMLDAVQSFDLDEDQAMEVMTNEDIANDAWTYWKKRTVGGLKP